MSCFDSCENVDLPIEKLKLQSKVLQDMLNSPMKVDMCENDDKENVANRSLPFQSPAAKSNKRESSEVVEIIVQNAGLPSVLKRLKKDHLLSDLKKRAGKPLDGTPIGGKQLFSEQETKQSRQDDSTLLELNHIDCSDNSFETKTNQSANIKSATKPGSKKSPMKSPVKSGSKYISKKTVAATRAISPFSKLNNNAENNESKPQWQKYTSRTSFPPKIQPLKKIISNYTSASKQSKTPSKVSPPHVDIKRIKSEYEQNLLKSPQPSTKNTPSKLNSSHYSPVQTKPVSSYTSHISYNPNAFKSPFSYVGPSTGAHTKGSCQKKFSAVKHSNTKSTIITSTTKATTANKTVISPAVVQSSSYSNHGDQSIDTSMIKEEEDFTVHSRQLFATDDQTAMIAESVCPSNSSSTWVDHDEVIMELTANDDDPLRQSAELDFMMSMTEYNNCLPNQFDDEQNDVDDDGTLATEFEEEEDDESSEMQSKSSSKQQQNNRLIRLSMLRTSIHSHKHSRQSHVIVDDGFEIPISKRLSLDGGDMQGMFDEFECEPVNEQMNASNMSTSENVHFNGTHQTHESKNPHIESFYATDPSVWSANIATCVNPDNGSNSFIAITGAVSSNRSSTSTTKLDSAELQSTTNLTPIASKSSKNQDNNNTIPLDSLWGYCDSFSKRCEFFLSLVVELKNHPLMLQTASYMTLLIDTEKYLEKLNTAVQQFSKHRSEYHGIAGAMMHHPEEYFVFLLNKTILDGIDLFSMIFEADYHEKVFGLEKDSDISFHTAVMKALDDIYQAKHFGTLPASNVSVVDIGTVISSSPETIQHRITVLIFYLEKINGEIKEFATDLHDLLKRIESIYQENLLNKQLEPPAAVTNNAEDFVEDAVPSTSFVRFLQDEDDPLMQQEDGNAVKLRALRQSLLTVMSLTNKPASCSISTIPESREEDDEEDARILEIQRTSSGDSTLTSFTFDTFPTINRNSLPSDELMEETQQSATARSLLAGDNQEISSSSSKTVPKQALQSTTAAVIAAVEKPKKQVEIQSPASTNERYPTSPVRPLPPMNTPNPKFGVANVPMTPMSPFAMYGGQMTTSAPHLPISPFAGNTAVGAASYQELLAQQETEDIYELATYLREKVHCTVSDSNKYAAMLVKNGVAGVDVLRRRLQREPQYLMNLGVDHHVAMDIFEVTMKGYAMLPPAATSPMYLAMNGNNSSFIMPPGHGLSPTRNLSPLRVPSNNSMISASVSNIGSVGIMSVPSSCSMDMSVETNSMSIYHELQRQQLLQAMGDDASTTAMEQGLLASEIAKLYYDATQRRSTEATNSLINAVEQQQNPIAKGYLMRMYALGQGGVSQDKSKAYQLGQELLPWLLHQVDLVNSLDLTLMYLRYLLGVCYSEGLGTRQNMPEALRWYTLSAEQGYPAAQAYLGHCYYTASGGVNKNLEEAVKWYKLAAKQGYAAAQCNLGICYEHGHGTKKNVTKAIHWYTLAGEQGDMNALYNLGFCYEHGLGNILPSLTKAFHFYEKSSKYGHIAAQYRVGYCYYAGLGISEPNLTQAFHYFSLSGKRGYPAGICMMGLCYEYGHGIELNISQAVQCYQKSASMKHPPAMCYLGLCYYHGKGMESINLVEAGKWFQRSADLGCAEAQYLLGECYYQGKGVNKNLAMALKWYRLSAKQSNQDAIRALRTLFEMDEFK